MIPDHRGRILRNGISKAWHMALDRHQSYRSDTRAFQGAPQPLGAPLLLGGRKVRFGLWFINKNTKRREERAQCIDRSALNSEALLMFLLFKHSEGTRYYCSFYFFPEKLSTEGQRGLFLVFRLRWGCKPCDICQRQGCFSQIELKLGGGVGWGRGGREGVGGWQTETWGFSPALLLPTPTSPRS